MITADRGVTQDDKLHIPLHAGFLRAGVTPFVQCWQGLAGVVYTTSVGSLQSQPRAPSSSSRTRAKAVTVDSSSERRSQLVEASPKLRSALLSWPVLPHALQTSLAPAAIYICSLRHHLETEH